MKDLIISVFNILKYIGRFFTYLRNIFLNLLLVLVLVTIIFALLPKEVSEIPSGTVLKLEISGDIVEEKKLQGTLETLLGGPFTPDAPAPETTLQDILDSINEGAEDDNIAALLLDLKNMSNAGINQLQSIGQALEVFKDTGKTVVAAEDYYTQSQYFLASFSDKIILNPMGGVDLHGFGVYRLYFKEALDKLEINYNVFKVGTYKSALEPFTRDSMSPEDKQQSELWLSALWQFFTNEIAKQRNISLDALHYYTDNIAEALISTNGNTAQLALKTGLVDQISTREETSSYLAALTKNSSGTPHILSSRDYLNSITPSYTEGASEQAKIGLIIAEGNILPGKQPPGIIGGDSLAKLIKKQGKIKM